MVLITALPSILNLCESRYTSPVYTTEYCPKDRTEWLERSSALNCNKENGYMCIPNKELTVLLEFCYNKPKIIIPKGMCLFFNKPPSVVDVFICQNFSSGCPNSFYFSDEIYQQQSCITIGKGCFLAEPNCNRYLFAQTYDTPSRHNTKEKTRFDLWIPAGAVLFCWLLVMVLAVVFVKRELSANQKYEKLRTEDKNESMKKIVL